jgi:hypothetical protein
MIRYRMISRGRGLGKLRNGLCKVKTAGLGVAFAGIGALAVAFAPLIAGRAGRKYLPLSSTAQTTCPSPQTLLALDSDANSDVCWVGTVLADAGSDAIESVTAAMPVRIAKDFKLTENLLFHNRV